MSMSMLTQIAERLIKQFDHEAGTESADRASAHAWWRSIMSQLRELAYRLDPALWVREVLGVDANAMAGSIAAGASLAPRFWR